jgi:AraC-like DNA-binding protein
LARHCLCQAVRRRRDELIECFVGLFNSPQQRRLYYFEISVDVEEVSVRTEPKQSQGPKNESALILIEDRLSDSPFIERVWRSHSERGGKFISVAASNFEMVLTRLRGQTFFTLRGPETKATTLDCPVEGEWLGIRFKPGTFMPKLLPAHLSDHKDVNLPAVSTHSFWLDGSAWQYPNFENVEKFVLQLARAGIISRDSTVDRALQDQPQALSLRSVQRHFLRATGMTYAAFRQIERARYATVLLKEGASIPDAIYSAGYFDQAHLTRSLTRLIGQTPGEIIGGKSQLSFLYKTEMPE